MKKTAIALAMAGVVAAPAAFADTTVYGSLRLSAQWSDPDNGDSNWDVVSHSSRLGFKGSEDLGNGLSAVYRYEFRVNAANGGLLNAPGANRLAYVGLKGGWGSLTIGTQWNPYYFAVAGEVDLYNALAASAGGYYNNAGFTRSTNMLVYTSPSFGGFTAYGALEMDGEAGDDNIDRWQLVGIYDNGPLLVGAGWRNTSDEVGDNAITGDDQNQYGIQGRFRFGAFTVAGEYNINDQFDDKTGGWDLLGTFRFGRNRIHLSYFDVEDGDSPDGIDRVDDKGWGVGWRHDLSGRTRVFVEYGETKPDGDKSKQFNVGMRHDF